MWAVFPLVRSARAVMSLSRGRFCSPRWSRPSVSRKRTSTESIRRAREDLEPGFYNSLTYLVVGSFESKEPTTTYFELWTQGFITLMEEKGVITHPDDG